MDEIICKIIELDSKARTIVAEACKERDNIDETIKSEIESIKEDLSKRAENKCLQIKKMEDEDALAHTEEAKSHIEKMKKNLEYIYNQNHEKWVNDISSEIINIC